MAVTVFFSAGMVALCALFAATASSSSVTYGGVSYTVCPTSGGISTNVSAISASKSCSGVEMVQVTATNCPGNNWTQQVSEARRY